MNAEVEKLLLRRAKKQVRIEHNETGPFPFVIKFLGVGVAFATNPHEAGQEAKAFRRIAYLKLKEAISTLHAADLKVYIKHNTKK